MAHEFLSEGWFEAVEAMSDEAPVAVGPAATATVNVKVVEGPNGDIAASFRSGLFQRGHAPNAPTTLTVPYEVAKSIFLVGDTQAAMQAFMAGKVRVTGDVSVMMSLQTMGVTDEQKGFQQRLLDITS